MSIIRPINWGKPNTNVAERLIRQRAQDTSNVIIGDHAFDRVEEREILQADVYRILRAGFVENVALNSDGDWEALVSMRLKGTRDAGVVTIIFCNDSSLFVKTVMWRDTQ